MNHDKPSGGFRTAGDLGGAPAPKGKSGTAVKERPAPKTPVAGTENGSTLRISMGKKGVKTAPETGKASEKIPPKPAPAPVVTAGSAKAPTAPAFMRAGDLLSAASGSHKESKGDTWDDYTLENEVTVIGRSSKCDIVTDQGGIALEHAKITRYNGRYVLSDCNSDAGTYVNGSRLCNAVYLNEKDRISLGSTNYVFSEGKLIYAKTDNPIARASMLRSMEPGARPVVLTADIATKKVKNNSGTGMKELIRDIHLEVREGSLVAMLGTAGAGKSTVMNCMNGMDLQGVKGSVHFREVDLVRNFEQMKHLIGSVPQKKVFHPSFTPEEEFRQAATLRLPADTTRTEITQRVDQTLEMLSMTGVRRNRNSKLSGGEQTRVNVGIELVADRDMLCMDEPDQGLSPNYKHELFEILQNLSHNHCKTVISIIHDVSEIDMFDQVIMLTKVDGVGRLAFSGSPADAREYFGVEIRDVYSLLEREPERFVK